MARLRAPCSVSGIPTTTASPSPSGTSRSRGSVQRRTVDQVPRNSCESRTATPDPPSVPNRSLTSARPSPFVSSSAITPPSRRPSRQVAAYTTPRELIARWRTGPTLCANSVAQNPGGTSSASQRGAAAVVQPTPAMERAAPAIARMNHQRALGLRQTESGGDHGSGGWELPTLRQPARPQQKQEAETRRQGGQDQGA